LSINNPNEPHASLQVVGYFLRDFVGRVILAADFDNQLGNGFQISFGRFSRWQRSSCDKSSIRTHDMIWLTVENDGYFGVRSAQALHFSLHSERSSNAILQVTM